MAYPSLINFSKTRPAHRVRIGPLGESARRRHDRTVNAAARHLPRLLARLWAALLVVPVLAWGAHPVQAQTPPTQTTATWTLAALSGAEPGQSEPLQLLGYAPTVDLPFSLPPGWQPDGPGELALPYRISEFVRTDARVTVRLNAQNITSLNFGSDSGKVTVTLPQEALRPGANLLTFAGLLPFVDDEECIVPNHPARWLEFSGDGTLAVPVAHGDEAIPLAAFPQQFAPLGQPSQTPVTFVLQDEAGDAELSALAAVAFALARRLPADMPWIVETASTFAPGTNPGPTVLIVTDAAASADASAGASPPAATAAGGGDVNGWLSLTYPAWANGYPVLLIGGADGAGTLAAADALVDQRRVVQMTGTTAAVDQVAARMPVTPTETLSLGDLGYGERVARGDGEQSLIYAFDLPFAWSMRDAALTLQFVHAPTIDPNVGSLSILVNGLTVGGVRLDASESTVNDVPLLIPGRLLRPGRNFLRLTFDFGVSERICREPQADAGPWASVRPDTSLTFNHGVDGARLDLNDYPYLFAEANDLAALTIALPPDRTQAEVMSMVAIVRNLSMRENLARAAPRVTSAPSAEMPGHFVVLGEPDRQPLLTTLNPYLPVPFDLTTDTLMPLNGIRVPEDVPDLGVIQTLRGVRTPQQAIVVVSGTSARGYELAQRMVSDPHWIEFLAGQLTVAAPGTEDLPIVYTQAIADVATVPVIGPIDTLLNGWLALDDPWRMVIPIGAAAVLAGLAYVLFDSWQRRRRARAAHH